MQNINWRNIKLLIFDVDGTLYDQQRLRRRMFLDLVFHTLLRPGRLTDLSILRTFRKERERNREKKVDNLEESQYEWCRLKTGADTKRIRSTVIYWMHEYPLKYLPRFVFPGIKELMDGSRKLGIPVAVLSDYPAERKLKVMNLQTDFVVSATQPEVNCLKPDPGGLNFIAGHFRLSPAECLFIGDRQDTDGVAAEKARMNCIIAERRNILENDLYTQILTRLGGK